MLRLEYWLPMRGESEDASLVRNNMAPVALTFSFNGFFSQPPLAFGSVVLSFECRASLC